LSEVTDGQQEADRDQACAHLFFNGNGLLICLPKRRLACYKIGQRGRAHRMKRICSVGVAGIATFALLQSAEAYPRGAARSFASTPRFSAPRFSAPAPRYSAPTRSFSNSAPRFNTPARFSSAPRFQNRVTMGPRNFSPTALRNPAYTNRTRISGDRTTAFNARTYGATNERRTTVRTAGVQSQAFDRGRIVARHPASWHRNWDRHRDHKWRGHRCHFRNNVWIIYDPWPFYPYPYGFYPYGSYYDATYYDDSAVDEPTTYTNQPDYENNSRVSEVQSALAREGYYDGAIDGRLGPVTRRALRNYQRDHRLPMTGNIDRSVIEALRLR
jgi:hypothetical protein